VDGEESDAVSFGSRNDSLYFNHRRQRLAEKMPPLHGDNPSG